MLTVYAVIYERELVVLRNPKGHVDCSEPARDMTSAGLIGRRCTRTSTSPPPGFGTGLRMTAAETHTDMKHARQVQRLRPDLYLSWDVSIRAHETLPAVMASTAVHYVCYVSVERHRPAMPPARPSPISVNFSTPIAVFMVADSADILSASKGYQRE